MDEYGANMIKVTKSWKGVARKEDQFTSDTIDMLATRGAEGGT